MESVSDNLSEIFFSIEASYRIIFIFCIALIEGLPIIGSFFPGGAIALFIGILTNEGFINPISAIVLIALGSFVGDMTGYIVGKRLKHKKWIRKILEHEKHQKKWDIFDRHIVLIILFSRVVPIIRSIPSIFAGARNIKSLKYILLSLSGSFIWAIGGVYGGNLISKVAGKYAIPIILGIVVISILITIIFKKKK